MVAVTKEIESAYFKEEALAPLPLSAMQITLTKLAQNVAALKQGVDHRGKNHCAGTLKRTENAGGVATMDTYPRTVSSLNSETPPGDL